MEYCDLHCDTPLRKNPIVNNEQLRGLSANINFAFCFLHNETFEDKKKYFDNFLSSSLLKNKNLKYVLSLEGLREFNTIDEVVYFIEHYNVRIVSLAWFEFNKWGCGAIKEDHGVTDLGKNLLKILNERKIIIDISHASENTSKNIFDIAETVIATHSNIFSVEPHPRNLRDWQLDELKKRDSVFGLNMYNKFLGKSKDSLFKHIEYALKKGYDNLLALGSDLDGMDDGYITSPAEIPELYNEIKNRFSENIAGLIFRNKRVMDIFNNKKEKI